MPWVAPAGADSATWSADASTTATWAATSDTTTATYTSDAAPDNCDGLASVTAVRVATGGAIGIDTAYRVRTPNDWCVTSTYQVRLITSNLRTP